eukprot:432280-Pleurochrysis_carterae.AAC.4
MVTFTEKQKDTYDHDATQLIMMGLVARQRGTTQRTRTFIYRQVFDPLPTATPEMPVCCEAILYAQRSANKAQSARNGT